MAQKPGGNIVYKSLDPKEISGTDQVFENATFSHCDFSYADLSNLTFLNCAMENCNFSLAKVVNTVFQQVAFQDCKCTGINFTTCNSFSFAVSFTKCILDYTIYHKKKMKATRFDDCSLIEADFTEADLSSVVFDNCNLDNTIFNRTILKGADFTTALNFNIDPDNNTIAKARFRADALMGLLTKYNLVIE